MGFGLKIILVFLATLLTTYCIKPQIEEVHGYHFHVYFFEGVKSSEKEALLFRNAIDAQIKSGFLKNCIVKAVNHGPFGPHPVANYETCCNKTSISQALSFFMLNHGNLTVLFHPLTRYEKMDHTGREMFLGPRIPIHVDDLQDDLMDYSDTCNSAEQSASYKLNHTTRVNAGKVPQS